MFLQDLIWIHQSFFRSLNNHPLIGKYVYDNYSCNSIWQSIETRSLLMKITQAKAEYYRGGLGSNTTLIYTNETPGTARHHTYLKLRQFFASLHKMIHAIVNTYLHMTCPLLARVTVANEERGHSTSAPQKSIIIWGAPWGSIWNITFEATLDFKGPLYLSFCSKWRKFSRD